MKKVALVTGASRGIGRYLVDHLELMGYATIGCSRSVINTWNHETADVTKESDVEYLFKIIKEKYGRLDVVINNAGISSMNMALLTPFETANKIINTNFMGTFLICRHAARLMIPQNYGRIINMSTIAVPLNLEGESIYVASKIGIEGYTRVLAKELGRYKITCNVIAPTPIETNLIKNVPRDKLEDIINRQAIKRMGEFSDVANVVDFFINPNSEFITGQTIYLGGIC